MFSVIIPLYKKKLGVMDATRSLLAQTYSNWELIIINDAPDDTSFLEADFMTLMNSDPRIRYYLNEKNEGVNFTRNRGLDLVSETSDWIVFLDHNDYFAPDTLETLLMLTRENPHNKWFLTNRALLDGSSLTKFPKTNDTYSYAWSYLISKRCKGDATHCISHKLIKDIRFSKSVKQAEEWFFYYQVGLRSPIYYFNHNSTISEGYDVGGLNFRKRKKLQELKNVWMLFAEASILGFSFYPSYLVYMLMRLIRIVVK